MDRASLEAFLSEGLSLEEIGRRVGKHASTVGYWLAKHELHAVNRERYAPKGGIDRGALSQLADQGLTLAAMATELRVSVATVRYWLSRHELASRRAQVVEDRKAMAAEQAFIERPCRHHGRTRFVRDRRGTYRCARCRTAAVSARRRRVKAALVREAGGRCLVCGYDRYVGALQFHHLDPDRKGFALSVGGLTRSIDRARGEMKKCVLLCANCHAEVEAGVTRLPPHTGSGPRSTPPAMDAAERRP